MCSTLVLFAEDPGADAEGGGLENASGDNTGTPIGDYIWVLALAVVIYAFWKMLSFLENKRDAKH
jgi:hypothetical protein